MRWRFLAGLALLLCAACTTWTRRPLPELAEKGPEVGEQVRITMLDGRELEWRRVRIEHDSLIGTEGQPGERAAVAVAAVRRVEVRSFSWGRTGGLTFGIIVVLSAVTLVALVVALVGAAR